MIDVTAIQALSDPTRRRLLEHLRAGPSSVGDLVRVVEVSQPAVSQHLQVLLAARLVRVERHGKQRIYHLNPEGLAELRAYVESFWEQVLRSYQQESASSQEETRDE
jgi:DNA-binding transcriptional ArsR family regulator